MFEDTMSQKSTATLCVALVVLLALGTMAFCGCSAQTAASGSSSSASAVVEEFGDEALEEDPNAESGIVSDDEVDRASIITGEGVGGTAPASPEQVALAQSIASQLEVPIRDGISFSIGPLLVDESQGDEPLRAILFYDGPQICASAQCTEDGTIYGESAPYMVMPKMS